MPLESEIKWHGDEFQKDGLTIVNGHELSIIEMIAREINREGNLSIDAAKTEAHYQLFSHVLKNIIKNNPFYAKEMGDYQRGECAAENIYIACCLLLQNIGLGTNYEINKPDIHGAATSSFRYLQPVVAIPGSV
ncbi:hypothetical protein FACS1894185_5340 [Betaproteobacteria bacterium]|nr:hypothetical protein FACS1894185_5340 [Betaproteobacteria bacterium]